MAPVDLVVAGLTGLAASFVGRLGQRGADWLIEKFKAHGDEAQEQARKNTLGFLVELGRRVERLEKTAEGDVKGKSESAFATPDFTVTMRKAVLAAATTASAEKRALLADIIASRLTAGPEDMVSLLGGAACDVVTRLTARQIHLLALMAKLYKVRPARTPQINSPKDLEESLASFWRGLDRLVVLSRGVTDLDYEHLVGMSCIRVSVGVIDRWEVFRLDAKSLAHGTLTSLFTSQSWWSEFDKLWDSGLCHCGLTSIGSLVGTLHHDRLFGGHTPLNWD